MNKGSKGLCVTVTPSDKTERSLSTPARFCAIEKNRYCTNACVMMDMPPLVPYEQ